GPRVEVGVAERLGGDLVEAADAVEHPPPRRRVDPRGVREVEYRVVSGSEPDPLVLGREEAAPPEPREDRLVGLVAAPLRDQDDERGEVLVLAPAPVAQPGAEA